MGADVSGAISDQYHVGWRMTFIGKYSNTKGDSFAVQRGQTMRAFTRNTTQLTWDRLAFRTENPSAIWKYLLGQIR